MKIAQATIPVALTFGLRFVEISANNFNTIEYRCWSDSKGILRPLVQTIHASHKEVEKQKLLCEKQGIKVQIEYLEDKGPN